MRKCFIRESDLGFFVNLDSLCLVVTGDVFEFWGGPSLDLRRREKDKHNSTKDVNSTVEKKHISPFLLGSLKRRDVSQSKCPCTSMVSEEVSSGIS